MRRILNALLTITLVLAGMTGHASAQIKGEVVGTKVIWDQARINRDSDIVRFKDRWFVVCQETAFEASTEAALRVISSKDGDQWESVALIKSPTPKTSLYRPAFSLTSDGRLMIVAQGAMRWEIFDKSKPEPTPRRLAMAWFSKDGGTWSEPTPITGGDGYVLNRVVWNKDVAMGFVRGESCGNWAVNLFSSHNGKSFESVFARHFDNESRPGTLAMIVDGDRAHCLMSRYSSNEVTGQQTRWPWKTGLLGTAKGPHYDEWEWKAINVPIAHANLLRLPDQRIIAVAGLNDPEYRTSLCEFDLATRKLTEFLELPKEWQRVSLAHHDGHLWVSYHAEHAANEDVYLAKVKLTQ
ncbi:MAG: hypothetical protein JWM11_3275 [Planctomycetaceae bacterium]|nr:hypothetical protein [Planctomycetaceae bacterium]